MTRTRHEVNPRLCSVCSQPGHNSRTCSTRLQQARQEALQPAHRARVSQPATSRPAVRKQALSMGSPEFKLQSSESSGKSLEISDAEQASRQALGRLVLEAARRALKPLEDLKYTDTPLGIETIAYSNLLSIRGGLQRIIQDLEE